MPHTHGKNTVIILYNTSEAVTGNISAWTQNSSLTRGRDQHDNTGYGSDDYTFSRGLKTGQFTMSGWYDTTTTTGTSDVLGVLQDIDELTTVIRRVQGTGAGKPQQVFQVAFGPYEESSPYNDIVRWSIDGTVSGPVTESTQ